MLGGVRGALSIALAATITTSVVISQTDLHTINTMVFGVAFISIMIQVPILFRYVRRKIPDSDAFKETALDEEFAKISFSIEELHKLRSEGKISDMEFTERLERSKMMIEKLMTKFHPSLETRKIIRARTSALFPSLQKLSIRKKKNEVTDKKENSEEKPDSS